MRYSIIFAKNAKKDIAKLSPQVQKRIKQKVLYFLEQENPLELATQLKDSKEGHYRWRVGVYRIIFDVFGGNTIAVLKVGHRREVYRK